MKDFFAIIFGVMATLIIGFISIVAGLWPLWVGLAALNYLFS